MPFYRIFFLMNSQTEKWYETTQSKNKIEAIKILKYRYYPHKITKIFKIETLSYSKAMKQNTERTINRNLWFKE